MLSPFMKISNTLVANRFAVKTLDRAVGNFITGDKFWDREKEIQLFTELLDESAHILMAAPRRIGKTRRILVLH